MSLEVFCYWSACKHWVTEEKPCAKADLCGRVDFDAGVSDLTAGCEAFEEREEGESDG